MCIINAGNALEPGNGMTGNNAVKINGTDSIHFPEHQVAAKPEIVFEVKYLAFIEPAAYPLLFIFFFGKSDRRAEFSSNQCNSIAIFGQRLADAMHPLVISQVIGNCKVDSFQKI